MKNSKFHRFLRDPLLHFLLIGGAMFLLYNQLNEAPLDSKQIVINQAQINHLKALWKRKSQRQPTQFELNSMVKQFIREEVMVREALKMGLNQNDGVIRRRLAQKMEFISADIAALAEPTETQLADYLKSHSENFAQPAYLSFEQVFASYDKHDKQTQAYAASLLKKLQEKPATNISKLSDSIMLDQQYLQITQHDITRIFGKAFASKIFSLPVGDWQGPVTSGYGVHLIRINHKVEKKLPPLNTVREKVRAEWMAQQRRDMDKTFYETLRQSYEIIIEDAAVNNAIAGKTMTQASIENQAN